MTSTSTNLAVVTGLTTEQIDLLRWEPVTGCPGVHAKHLWRGTGLETALLRYDSGATTAGNPHHGAHQFIWVVEGEASIGGHRLSAGSYAHIPPGSPHPIRAITSQCVLLQTHAPAVAVS